MKGPSTPETPPAPMDRRRFITLAGAGTLGMALWRPRPARAFSPAAWWPLIKILGEFVGLVGAQVLGNSISEYLKGLQEEDAFKRRIRLTNELLARHGFRDQSTYTRVYASASHDPRIYYPLVNSHCSCLNFTAPFFRLGCGCEPVTLVQGPQLAGLTLAAQMLRQRLSPLEVASYLIPMTGERLSQGTPQAGYDGPLIYHSAAARVRVDYRRLTPNSGVVMVRARRRTDQFPVVSDEWGLSFP